MAINPSYYYEDLIHSISIVLKIDSNLNTNSWLSYEPTAISNDLVSHNIGADANSGELIYYTDLVAKTFTTYSSSLYNGSSFVTDYYYADVTKWIWPKNSPNLNNCNFPLPSLNMSKSNDVHVGK